MGKNRYTLQQISYLEQAIANKYGFEALQHPSCAWTAEKEESYQNYIKVLSEKEYKSQKNNEIINLFGFLIPKKLIRNSNRVCPKCNIFSFKAKDDIYMNKFNCCYKCYIIYFEGRNNEDKKK